MLIGPGLVFHTPDICGRKSELKIAWAALVIVWSRRLYNAEEDRQGGKFGTHASKIRNIFFSPCINILDIIIKNLEKKDGKIKLST